jgi:oxygen-independent coproporphyrinogen-3 oxidase
MGVYLHVPFCASRCGYCDFNTYTVSELSNSVRAGQGLGGPLGPMVTPANVGDFLAMELGLAGERLGGCTPAVGTVFLGGGTPNLVAPQVIADLISRVRGELGLAPDAEVTIEANPDSIDERMLGELRAAGCTRVSFGMQSAKEHVLRVLERTHSPGATELAVRRARAAGFLSVSVDLIYGTPGESLGDWRETVGRALELGVDHVSAYALIVEPGTRMAAAVRRGTTATPDDDLMADMYLVADDLFCAAGLGWYELSNWARPGHECRHNLGYWSGHNWWGAGPGAHSHISGIRWWNRKHPAAWASRLRAGESPAQARETLSDRDARLERIMLQSRLATGIELDSATRPAAASLVAEGLARPAPPASGGGPSRIVLTRAGRLLADAVVLRLT